jgi:hypothetical protein
MKLEILSVAHHANTIAGAPFDVVEFSNDDMTRFAIVFETKGHCAILEDTKIFEGDFAFDSNSYHGEPIEPHLRKAVAEFSGVKKTDTTGTEAKILEAIEYAIDNVEYYHRDDLTDHERICMGGNPWSRLHDKLQSARDLVNRRSS